MNARERKRKEQAAILEDLIHKAADRLWDALEPLADTIVKRPVCAECWHWQTRKLFKGQKPIIVTTCTNWDGEKHCADDEGCKDWRLA